MYNLNYITLKCTMCGYEQQITFEEYMMISSPDCGGALCDECLHKMEPVVN